MKKASSKQLTRAELAELKSLAARPDKAIDTSDAPEILDWSGAKRGLFYRPIKQQLTLRLDADVIVSAGERRKLDGQSGPDSSDPTLPSIAATYGMRKRSKEAQ